MVAAPALVLPSTTPLDDDGEDGDDEEDSPLPGSPGTMFGSDDDEDVLVFEDLPALPPVRPPLQPGDIIAAIRSSAVVDTVAVANRLRQHFHVTPAAADALPTVMAGMHLARTDLARVLGDEVVQQVLARAPAVLILGAAVRRLETVLTNSELMSFQSSSS